MLTIEKIFDKSAKSYEKTEEVRFKEANAKTIENSRKYLKSTDIILDYGCATGTKALELAGSVKKVHGIDISSKMIELAERKLAEGHISNVTFEKTTIYNNKLQKESFDVITAFNILHLLEDPGKAIERIVELLKPGGLFISSTPCLQEKMNFLTKLQFSFIYLIMKLKLFPSIILFKFSQLKDLIKNENIRIIEEERKYYELSGYFIVARKAQKK